MDISGKGPVNICAQGFNIIVRVCIKSILSHYFLNKEQSDSPGTKFSWLDPHPSFQGLPPFCPSSLHPICPMPSSSSTILVNMGKLQVVQTKLSHSWLLQSAQLVGHPFALHQLPPKITFIFSGLWGTVVGTLWGTMVVFCWLCFVALLFCCCQVCHPVGWAQAFPTFQC